LPAPSPAANDVNGDYDDYDPEAITLEPTRTEPMIATADDFVQPTDDMAIVHFELPVPEKVSATILKTEFQLSIDRILQSIRNMDISHRAGIQLKSPTLESLAITDWDKEAWTTILSRLSSRALTSIDSSFPNILRERLFEYIMINFREHMDLIISWLTEEWYNDQISNNSDNIMTTGTYEKWSTRIFDNILPFIEAKDSRIFLRFLGDLPLLTRIHVGKLKTLCLDPERQKLGFAAIKYLLLLRPPTREACIELCVDLFQNRILPDCDGY
jgi:symplekin